MSSTLLSFLACACTFVAALLGVTLRGRLPAHHLDGDSKDSVKLVMGLIATMTALVLGLLISSAHSAFDAQDAEVQQLGVHVYEIDRLLARFGPDAAPQRALMWAGPNNDASSAANDPSKAAEWPPGRTIRADLIRWLAADPSRVKSAPQSVAARERLSHRQGSERKWPSQ